MTADYPGQEMNVCVQANMSVATTSLGRGGGNEWKRKSQGLCLTRGDTGTLRQVIYSGQR